MHIRYFSLPLAFILTPAVGFALPNIPSPKSATAAANFHSLSADDINGKMVIFSEFKNKVLLVVNTASQCGYTPQYRGLEAIYQKYKAKGFVILGFPSNDFGGQEPGSNTEVKKFCEFKFKVSFPMFSKVNITSLPRSSVYEFLTVKNPNIETRKTPEWNFWKFLIDKHGNVKRTFASGIEPESKELSSAIEDLLAAK
ncbi:glutathione peroxidase [bacterium]|nr:glutathione peroxidase [bacterium]